MCGISGFFLGSKAKFEKKNLEELNKKISKTIHHRGPDKNRFWNDSHENIYFGHNRLEIIDLTESGDQPMYSSKGNKIIIYNGEIYNHTIIRKKLATQFGSLINWRGRSDTEVLINAIEFWGLEKTMQEIKGMFAFVVWDKKEKKLTLCRDRFGEKPLYYCKTKDGFYFASEIKSLKIILENKFNLSEKNFSFFLDYGFNINNETIFEGIKKLPCGSYIELNELNLKNNDFKIIRYWQSDQVVKNSLIDLNKKNLSDICNDTELILENIIKNQLIADVETGVFLSGGTDSALITALAQKVSEKQISTFSIGFDVEEYDESKSSFNISKELNTNHSNFVMTSNDFENIIDNRFLFDEPFFDISQYPTYLLCNFASQKVKVCLTGDGGDEIFGGYNRHLLALNVLPKLLKFSKFKKTSYFIKSILKKLDTRILSLLLKIFKLKQLETKTNKILSLIDFESEQELYEKLIKIDNDNSNTIKFDYENTSNMTNNFMINDTLKYLPNNILYKVDSLSMINSLETRSPYLDHELFAHVWKIPSEIKFYKKNSKYILKKILSKHINTRNIFKPKMGFDIPLLNWLKNSNKLRKNIKELYFLNSKEINNYIQIKESKDFEINEKNYLFVWKVSMIKKWLFEFNS